MGFIGSAIGAPVKAIGTVLGTRTNQGDIEDLSPNISLDGSQGQLSNKFGDLANLNNQQAAVLQGYAHSGAQAGTAGQQQDYINMLNAQAQGQGPSVSETLLRQGLDRNIAGTNALAGSAKGNVNPALLMRNAMNSNSNAAQGAAGQAMLGRQQEQLNAQGMLGGALTQMRGQDIQNAGLMNSLAQGYAQLGLGATQGQVGAAKDSMVGQLGGYGIGADVAKGNAANNTKIMGGLLNGAGAATTATMSQGGIVPGYAQVKGNSPSNDNVKALLSPGEIVVPRTEAQNPDRAKRFIEEISKQTPSKKATTVEFTQILKAQKELNEKLEKLAQSMKKGK